MNAYDCKTITHAGFEFRVSLHADDCVGEPWKEHDGHGPVSEWTSRDSWQCPAHRAEFLRIKRESMTDAHAWRGHH